MSFFSWLGTTAPEPGLYPSACRRESFVWGPLLEIDFVYTAAGWTASARITSDVSGTLHGAVLSGAEIFRANRSLGV